MHFRFGIMLTCVIGALVAGVSPTAARAGDATVASAGSAVVERQPQLMRMHVEVAARADTLEEALEILAERTRDARRKLGELNADADSIELGSPKLPLPEGGFADLMMAGMREDFGEDPLGEDEGVTVSAPLTAAWEIDDSADAAARLLDAHTLQTNIREADVAGMAGDERFEFEQEAAAEMMAMRGLMNMFGGSDPPGVPTFEFVATISDDERREALASAFAQARAEAELLAAATGSKLGALVSISSSVASSGGGEMDFDDLMGMSMQMMSQMMGGGTSSTAPTTPSPANPNEIVGDQVNSVAVEYVVSAAFALEP